MLTFNNRFYWFGRNLLGFVLFVTCIIPYFLWIFIIDLFRALHTLTIDLFRAFHILLMSDGSSVIGFPWEWDWRPRR